MDRTHIPTFLVIATLLAATLAAVPATAEAPPETGWSPASYDGAPESLTLSDTGGFAAFATGDPDPNSNTDSDLHFLNLSSGPVASQADDSFLQHEGTHHVASSPGGEVVVAGAEQPAGDAGTDTAEPNLHYFHRSDVPNAAWSKRLSQPVTDVDVSNGGSHVLVTTSTDSSANVYLYGAGGNLVKERSLDGTLGTAVLSEDGDWFAVGGTADTDAGRRAYVEVHARGGGAAPTATWTDDGDLPTEVLSLDITPDGRYLVAGTSSGRILSFHNDGGTLNGPHATELQGTRAVDVAISTDGHRVTAGATDGLHHLTRVGDGAELRTEWSYATSNPVVDLDATRDGAYIVSAVEGPDGVALGHHARRAAPIWTLPGSTSLAAVTGGPEHALFAHPDGNVTAVAFHRKVAAGFLGDDGNLTSEAPGQPSLQPHESGSFTLLVTNQGSTRDVYGVSSPATGTWKVESNRTQVDLLPGETAQVLVTVTPQSASAGDHEVPVEIRSTERSSVTAELGLPVHVEATSGIALRLTGDQGTRPASSGETVRAHFVVQNLGNQDVEPTFHLRQDPTEGRDWTVDTPRDVPTLSPGDTTTVSLSIDVPANTEPGTRNTLILTADAGNATASAAVDYVVDPFMNVEVSTDTTARHVNATIAGWFNITVQNTGSVDTKYVLVYEKTPHGTRGWVVDIPLDPFKVPRGSSTTIPVIVHAPANGVVGDKVNVKVQAIPEPMKGQVNPDVQDNVTVSAIFYDFPEEDKTFWEQMDERRRETPGFEPFLLIAAALAVTWVLPRTRRGR